MCISEIQPYTDALSSGNKNHSNTKDDVCLIVEGVHAQVSISLPASLDHLTAIDSVISGIAQVWTSYNACIH